MIAVICNIEDISNRIRARMLATEQYVSSGVSLVAGDLEGTQAILVSRDRGRTIELTEIESIVARFDVKILIQIDSAYPIVPYLQHGDMVVADNVSFYRPGGSAGFARYSVDADESASSLDRMLILQVVKVYETLFSGKSNRPQLIPGLVMTVEDRGIDKKSLQKLQRLQGGLAIDRDGAPVENLCRKYDMPLLLIRVIVDSDDKANDSDLASGTDLISDRVVDLIVQAIAAGRGVPAFS